MRVAEALARVGQALGGEIDEQKIIQAVLDGARDITGASGGRFIPATDSTAAPARSTCTSVRVVARSGELLGQLMLEHAPAAFGPREDALAAALASQLAIALENSRLLTALDRQRARAEEASRNYRFLAESVPQLVWTADGAGQVDYVNGRWTVFTGRPVAALLGDGWRAAVHPDDLERTVEAWTRAIAGELAFDLTCRLCRGDGSYRWHLVRAYSLCSETRSVLKWFGTCTDIHDQKRFEDSQRLLSEASRVLAASFDLDATLGTVASLVAGWFRGFCLIDLLGPGGLERAACAHVDPDRQRLFAGLREYAPGQDRSSPLWRVLESRRTDVSNHVTEEQLAAGVQSARHADLRRAAGTSAYIIAPLLAGGQVAGTIMVGLTGDERFEPDDVRPVEELAYRVAIAVTNARAYAEARDANRLKDEFLAIVSHELRTPLNAMRGWVALLRSARLPADQVAHALEVIERNVSAQTQIVEDLLDISRIVSGRMKLTVQPVRLAEVIEAALESVRLSAEARGIRIETELVAPDAVVNGDPDRLQQVLWNLLANAVKFTGAGGSVRLTLRAAAERVEVAVADTGQGISADFLPFVFERFRQGDSTSTRPVGGLGLGLAIVRHLVEQHGGVVTAASAGEGQGATFTVSLPAMPGVVSA
jgi:PAS domain S-box-containing protein